MKRLLERFPVLVVLASQVIALFLVPVIARLWADPSVPSDIWLLVHGVLAAALTLLAGGSRWWIPVQVAAPFAIRFGLGLELSPWWWLAGLGLLFLFYGGGVITRVPLYLSNDAACQELAALIIHLPQPRGVDLGAGFGGPMRHLAQVIPAGRFVSVEASPLTCLGAWLRARMIPAGRDGRLRVRWGDLWGESLTTYDLVYVFLSPAPMPRLWAKVQTEMRPGTLLVSNTFPVLGVVPERVIDLPGRADARLYIYRR